MVRVVSLHLPSGYRQQMTRAEYGNLYGGYADRPRYQGSAIGYGIEEERKLYERERKRKYRERQKIREKRREGESSKRRKIVNPYV